MTNQDLDRLASEASRLRNLVGARISQVRDRSTPSELADDAMDYAATKGQALLQETKTLVAAHPVAIAAGIAAIGIALLTKRHLSHAEVDLGDDSEDYSDYDERYSSSNRQREPASPSLMSLVAGLAAGALVGILSSDNK